MFKQISADQETAIVLLLSVTQYSIWIHRNSMVCENAVLNAGRPSIVIDIKIKIQTRYFTEKTRSNKTDECAITNFFHCV